MLYSTIKERPAMKKTASFYIVYDGPALENNEMDVRDLAPALLSISDTFEEANRVLNKNKASIAVNIRASFKTGCFGIEMSVVQNVYEATRSLFTGDDITAALNILQALGFTTGSGFGVLKILKWLNNRKIKTIEPTNNKKVKIITEDDDHIETENAVIELMKNFKIRESIKKAIAGPLENPGIKTFAIKHKAEDPDDFIIIAAEEISILDVPDVEEELIEDKTYETTLQALSVAFLEDNKWRFSDGDIKFFAEIADVDFIKQVQDNEIAFRKDDLLKVKIHKKQWLTEKGLKSEYKIIKIIEHKSAAIQLKLF